MIQGKYQNSGTMHRNQQHNLAAPQNPQLQGSQGAQIINQSSKHLKAGQQSPGQGKKEKIAVISLTKIDVTSAPSSL